jgi:metal-responsive CopG/Arc/MetJ family transcriptional regulator
MEPDLQKLLERADEAIATSRRLCEQRRALVRDLSRRVYRSERWLSSQPIDQAYLRVRGDGS